MICKDLYALRDDKTVLRNPHKGWYWHIYDGGLREPDIYHKGVADEDILCFPGLNHIYLRIDWYDVQPAKGVFDWTKVDQIIEKWSRYGYHFAFRVCCSETAPLQKVAVPQWLIDEGCKGAWYPPTYEENPEWWQIAYRFRTEQEKKDYDGQVLYHKEKRKPKESTVFHDHWEPDYGDPVFLKCLEEFIKGFAEKYDGDPRLEYVDIGSIGTWGEGHFGLGCKLTPPPDVLKYHAYLHAKYFKHTFIFVNDDTAGLAFDYSAKARRDLHEYFVSLGLGVRDDSIFCGDDVLERCYHTVAEPWMFDDMSQNAPTDLELAHYGYYSADLDRDGFATAEAARAAHASFMGFHGFPKAWLKDKKHLTEYLANRLGYWYFIRNVRHYEKAQPGAPILIELEWENGGFAPCYYRYELFLCLSDETGEKQYTLSVPEFDNRKFSAGQSVWDTYKIDLPLEMAPGKYTLSVCMKERDRVIGLALRPETCSEDGFYSISDIEIGDYTLGVTTVWNRERE